MDVFQVLILKIVPLYMNIVLGVLAGKFLDTSRDTLAWILCYIIDPIIILHGILHTRLDAQILSLPLLTFLLGTTMCLVFYSMAKGMWSDSTKNILAFSAGTGNTGTFGLPIALMLFSEEGEGIYIMALLGITLYANTVGYYFCAKGSHSSWDCIKKLCKLPPVYALFIGLALHSMDLSIPQVFLDFLCGMRETYSVLGMIVLGLCLCTLQSFRLDGKYILMTFIAKFLAWPLLVFAFIFCDSHYFGFYTAQTHKALILLSSVPIAMHSVFLGSLLKIHPEKAAASVLLSTLFALIYVPFMAAYFIAD